MVLSYCDGKDDENQEYYNEQEECNDKSRKIQIHKKVNEVKTVEKEKGIYPVRYTKNCTLLEEKPEERESLRGYSKEHALYFRFFEYVSVENLPYKGSFTLPSKKIIRSIEIQYENNLCLDLKIENENFKNYYVNENSSIQKPFVGYLMRAKNITNTYDDVPIKYCSVVSERNFLKYGGVEMSKNEKIIDTWMYKTKEHKWVINTKTPAKLCFMDTTASKSSKNTPKYEEKNLIVKEAAFHKVRKIILDLCENTWYTDVIDFKISPFSEGKSYEKNENNLNQPEVCSLTNKSIKMQKQKKKRVGFLMKVVLSDNC